MECMTCGHEMEITRGCHKYESSGVPNVFLENVELRQCRSCGEEEVVIPQIEKLHEVLARLFIREGGRLSGDRFRFLRKYLGWSAKDLAGYFEVTPETVSRWETNTKPVSSLADRLMRLCVAQFSPVEGYGKQEFEHLPDQPAVADRAVLRQDDDRWAAA